MTARRLTGTTLLHSRRGQALPLAAITLFVMALGVIATLNLGQAIYEKIRLQNAADSAAYSLAAIEARGLNFVALANRTQIVHYNSAMAVSAYLTYAGYSLAVLGTVKDLVADLADVTLWGCTHLPCAPVCVCCPYCSAYPWLRGAAAALYAIAKVAEVVYKIVHFTATQYIEAMGLMNRYIVWHMEVARLTEVNSYIVNGMEDIIARMYPKNGFTLDDSPMVNRWIPAVLNSMEFRQTFDPGSGLNPGIADLILFGIRDYNRFKNRETNENKDAVRVMTELANASRSHKAIYNREDSLNFITGIVNIHGKKLGTTKLIPPGDSPKPRIDRLRKEPYNYIIGDSIGSDDFVSEGWAFATIGISGVIFTKNTMKALGDGITAAPEKNDQHHYGYKLLSGTAAPRGTSGVINWPPFENDPKTSIERDKKCSKPQDHGFPGIAPYIKFNTRVKIGSKSNVRDYNQPSTWMILNIPPERIQTEGKNKKPWLMKFKWKNGSDGGESAHWSSLNKLGKKWESRKSTAELDTTIGGERSSTLLEGLTVISRAQVYYHRPDNWGEHPNLFNPFWRAKLAPVGEKLTKLFDDMTKGISGGTSEDESALSKLLKNGVRNFMNDVFFGVVTALITH